MRGMMRLALLGVPGAQGGGATPIVYLLRDEFLTDEAAPLTSPRAAEPGPGTLTLDVNAKRIEDGALIAAGDGGGYKTVFKVAEPETARIAGRMYRIDYIAPVPLYRFYMGILGILRAQRQYNAYNLEGASGITTDLHAVSRRMAYVVQSWGCYMYLYTVGESPLLVWVSYSTSSPIDNYDVSLYDTDEMPLSNLIVRDLPAPFATDNPSDIATVNEAAPVSGTPYTATADAIHDLEVTAPNPLSGSAALKYRVTDANNYWTAYLNDAGAFRADSVAAGTPTNRVNVAGVATADNTYTLRVICDGTTHNFYTLAGTAWTKRGGTVTLSHQDAATTVIPEATDYTLGALRSWPLRSSVYAELDRT